MIRFRAMLPAAMALAFVLAGAIGARADGLTINATFDPSYTAAEKAVVNQAISFYETTFSNPITVDINFGVLPEESNFVSESEWSSWGNLSYSQFTAALTAGSSGDATDTEALANLPAAAPTSTLALKPANMAALGLPLAPGPVTGNSVLVNLAATPVGGCDTTVYYCYNMEMAVEHEIDEVLGLGSGAGGNYDFGNALPEDLFRYNAAGQLSFYANGGAGDTGAAYFSLNGSTDLAQFHNVNDGYDFGDWQSFPYPPGANPQVQDALLDYCPYGSTEASCTAPTLNRNSNEVVALDAIGYNLQPTPEPTSVWLLGGGLLFMAGMAWRDRRRLVH